MRKALCTPPFFLWRATLIKTLLVMNMTAILFLGTCLTASAAGLAQNINISVKNAPLEKVFDEIKRQTTYTFVYYKDDLKNAKKITLQVSNISVDEVLQLVFKDQPVTYTIVDKVVIIKQKSLTADLSLRTSSSSLNAPPVTGIVRGPDGQPLVGVNVMIKGKNKGTVTDKDGKFSIEAEEGAELEISSIGFGKKIVTVSSSRELNVALEIASSVLDEVQYIAYGQTSKRFNVGNIGTVKATDIEKQPVYNPLLSLEGRIPGLVITQNTGLPGGSVIVRIQGQNSLGSGNDPLYIIDGVPYVSQLLTTSLGLILGSSGGGFGNPLNFINASDIESIDVLKDADATAIYGSRAANGAILITTKKGWLGETKIRFDIQNGWGKVTRKLPLLDTRQYLDMRYEAYKNDGIDWTNSAEPANDLKFWDTTSYTDWQKVLLGNTANYFDAKTTITAGAKNTSFLVAGAYHKETTVFPGDLSDQKGSLHLNINNSSSNQRFKFQLSANYVYDVNNLMSTDLTTTAIRMSPNAPDLYQSDGSLNWAQDLNGNSTWINPLSYLEQTYSNKTKNLISNAVLDYQVVRGLNVKGSFGFTDLQSNEILINPLSAIAPERKSTETRYSTFANSTITSWIAEPQLSYKTKIASGDFEVLVGGTLLQNNSEAQQYFASGFNSDQVMKDIKSAASVSVDLSVASTYKYSAIFGRVNYRWQDKYLINLTARRDGSSRFGEKNLFHNFGSVGAAWIFSDELFVRKHLPFISFGKMKASYGTTGNDQIGDYQFMNLYNPYGVENAYQGSTGLVPDRLPNPYLQWEETKKLQLGIELGLFADKISLTSTYFNNRSSNQLTGYALPYITGFNTIQTNFQALIENQGWEFSINSTNVVNKDFRWSTSANLTIPKSKLLSFPDFETSTAANQYAIGYPITLVKLFPSNGVDPASGLFTFIDRHGNSTTTLNYPADATVLVNTSPAYYGGLQNSFTFKAFELSFLFQFVKQLGGNYYLGNSPGSYYFSVYSGVSGNQPVWVLDRWQKPGDIKSHQQYSATYPSVVGNAYSNAQSSQLVYSDASFVRLKNLYLGWQLPLKWKQTIRFESGRIFLQGYNLITITNFKGMDPENRNTSSLPPLKVISIGIQITF